MKENTQIWRINLKPDDKNKIWNTKFCVENVIVGIGWGVDKPTNEDDYFNKGKIKADQDKEWKKGWKKAANAFINRVKVKDLIWARDEFQKYYLGKIKGDWVPVDIDDIDKEELKKRYLENIRDCEWYPKTGLEIDDVPGKVINSFRVGINHTTSS